MTKLRLAGAVVAIAATVAAPATTGTATASSRTIPLPCVGAQIDNDGTRFMHEDESPYVSPFGAELIAYSDGTAWYADATRTNGTCWFWSVGL